MIGQGDQDQGLGLVELGSSVRKATETAQGEAKEEEEE